MKMGIIILYVHDVAKSRAFYNEIVGLPVIEEQSGPTFVMLQPAIGSQLALEDVAILPAGQAKPAGSLEVGFEVEDVDSTYERWKQCGVEMVTPVEDMPFGRAFLAKDPEGHYITVYHLSQN